VSPLGLEAGLLFNKARRPFQVVKMEPDAAPDMLNTSAPDCAFFILIGRFVRDADDEGMYGL
jgi:hypothetical protein